MTPFFKGIEWDMLQKIQWITHQNAIINTAFSKSLKPGGVSDNNESRRLQ